MNKGEGVAELTWCSGQSVRAAQVRRPAAKASISCSCSSTEAWRIMPFKEETRLHRRVSDARSPVDTRVMPGARVSPRRHLLYPRRVHVCAVACGAGLR